MNHTDYTQHAREVRMESKSGRVCAVLTRDKRHWVMPTYCHPGENASESEKDAAHMRRCVPAQCTEWAQDVLESIDRAVFGGEG